MFNEPHGNLLSPLLLFNRVLGFYLRLLHSGLDLLLRRIAEGVRPPARTASSSRLPSSSQVPASSSTHPGEQHHEGGNNSSNSTTNSINSDITTISLPLVGAENEEGRGASQAKLAPALSTLVGGTNDRTDEGCGNMQRTSQNARANRVLREASTASAANFGTANTSAPRSPSIAFARHTKVVFREGFIGGIDKENRLSQNPNGLV